MKYLRKWIAVLLTVCMIMNMIPLSVSVEGAVEEIQIGTESTEGSNENTVTENEESLPSESPNLEETENNSSASEVTQTESEQQAELLESEEQDTMADQEESLVAANAISHVGDTFADMFIDTLNAANVSATIKKVDDNVIEVTIGNGDGKVLELLSKQEQTAESNYQNWHIRFSFTGELSLTEDFEGLGDEGFPFKGKFVGESITIRSSKTIFKALGAEADLNNVKINWMGTPDKPILTKKLVADANPHGIDMPLTGASYFSPYIEQLTGGAGLITLPVLNYSGASDSHNQEIYPGDVGLVCAKMDAGTHLKVGTIQLPNSADPAKNIIYLRASGSVGGLVGTMGENSELLISHTMSLKTKLSGSNAGGLVGSIDKGIINFEENCSIENTTELTATSGAAGGIAGVVSTSTGPLGTNANVKLVSVKANGSENAGVYYGNCTVTEEFTPTDGVTCATDVVTEVSGTGYCGGVFGTLVLDENGKCKLTGTDEKSLKISTTLTTAANTTKYGGIVGVVRTDIADASNARKNALVVEKCEVTSDIGVGNDSTKYPKYVGGIAAEQDKVTVDVKNITTNFTTPKTITDTDYGFGGVIAYVGDYALLMADSVKVITDIYNNNPGGGGVVGSAHRGSIVYLKTSLDLSGCPLTTNATTGQIVGYQDCSLVYAPGVTIKRNKKISQLELDDIGNYGEMYRIAEFLSVNPISYAVTFSRTLSKIGEEYQLSDALDYACLALAWQARGYFPTVSGITKDNWSTSNINSCNITLSNNIDLTGKGIGGFTRDIFDPKYLTNNANDTFSGSLNGNGKKITLDIGAENQDTIDTVNQGDGRIYRHNATGLFAVLSNGASISNLSLSGSIRLSNRQVSKNMLSGGLAANLYCDKDSNNFISGVSTEVNIHIFEKEKNSLYVGGIFGQVTGTKATTLIFNAGLNASITLAENVKGNGNYYHIGGAIGAIDKDSNITIECGNNENALILTGIIDYKKETDNIYAGGLVGTIFPGGRGKRTVNIQKLTVNGFKLLGNASDRMSGILGGIWANTDVNISGLTVSNATLSANGKAALGGLVYRSSGKWTVSSADFNGLEINAQNAKALGLMVCQGGPYKDYFNGNYVNVDGIFLEMTKHWDWNNTNKEGYRVPNSVTFNGEIYDEFVAYTGYSDRANNNQNCQITENNSGIVSLKTSNGTVNMTEGERNTYVNRTTVGSNKRTNLYSRYYYNLSEIRDDCNGGNINTAEELMIWSVYRYAASNLKDYFTIGNGDVTTESIGGSSSGYANFDMKGFSYYPVNITNADVTVQYANVKFYNYEIETKENGNKSTRGSASDHSQHYTMHCGLFMNFAADLTNASEDEDYYDRTMTVNGVSFAGSVGVVNGGSGALICGTVKGDTKEGNTTVRKVILADSDDNTKSVSLNGIKVVPEGDYTPVLINRFGSYSGLKAKYIGTTTEQTMKAGSSLLGDVGKQGATGISVEFEGTIKLPDLESDNIFSKATLLNSLQYENGTATYHFLKNKDYTDSIYKGDNRETTYGSEISGSVEYNGKNGCYYDGYGAGYFVSKTGNFDAINDFQGYLPYVAYSPAADASTYPLANGWHELAVNILSTELTEGCGTYGHPYQVDANLLKEIANYINTGSASSGWQIRIASDDIYHIDEGGNDMIITYDGNAWKNSSDEVYQGNVQQYLADAYYEIKEETIILKDFNGIGTNVSGGVPFTGVITGKKGKGTTITLSGGSAAFIKYSYGCVVRDISIVLDQGDKLSLERPTWERGAAEQVPKTFFGGVIGCVLGGDNIIENVSVSKRELTLISTSGTNPYLIPVGGYVGVIAGGGVIFRGTYSNDTGITGTDALLYRNPIIGRVLGGYAFYEGTGNAPDNGDKNYKINKIEYTSEDLNWNGSTLTVKNAQGLLLLSGIISSGGGSTNSNAYKKGKARNAAYNQIGKDTEPADYTTAKKDASTVWSGGNTPYLLRKYAGYTGNASICNSSSTEGINILFSENGSFDMYGYDNGYRGLSARYVSNAAFGGNDTANPVQPGGVVLRVKSFNGNAANVQHINMKVKEYENDDFHAASMGGIFNIVWTKKKGGGTSDSTFARNLTLTSCNVSLKYVDSNGSEKPQAKVIPNTDSDIFADEDGLSCVAVGGFIGSVSDIEADNSTKQTLVHNYLLRDIHIDSGEINGPNSAGGLIGASAMTGTSVSGYPGKLLSNSQNSLFGLSFLNCSYSNINVTAKLAAGGLAGYVYANTLGSKMQFSSFGHPYYNGGVYFKCFTSCTVTDNNLTVGSNSQICADARRGVAGGIFGGAGMRVGINDPNVNGNTGLNVANSTDFKQLRLNGVTIQSSLNDYDIFQSSGDRNGPEASSNNSAAAGIIGRIGNVNPTYFNNINMYKCTVKAVNSNANTYVGGIVGYGYTNTSMNIQQCQIIDPTIEGKYAGGFVGYGHSSGYSLNMSDCKIEGGTVKGSSYTGGIVGYASSKYYFFNILIKNTSITGKNPGRLFGWMNIGASNDNFWVYAAGISVYADKDNITIPSNDGNADPGRQYIGYISYSDYAGTDTPTLDPDDISPYVTINPNFTLDGVNKRLTGDAVGKIEGDTYGSVAARIWADQKTGATGKKNLVSYANAATIVNTQGKVTPEVSTFRAEQGCGPELPVLVLNSSDASVIEDYLNVITNGGFSKFERYRGDSYFPIGLNAKVYYYNNKMGQFTEQTSEQAAREPASIYLADGKTPRVSKNAYDNTRNRFTLIEASFTVTVNGQKRTYTVSVPVIVKRQLQYNFMSTFSYGAEFKAETFSNLTTHVLENAGNPITAYLTYEYNREETNFVEYDWQGYMNDGGNMLGVDKILSFSDVFPSGTEFILVDCQDGNRAYSYKVENAATETTTEIGLSDFSSVTNADKKFQSSMADILGVKVENVPSGKFIEVDKTEATIRRNNKYYRPIREGEEIQEGTKRYNLTVPDLKLQENTPRENYYLVINVPSDITKDINGSLSSRLDWEMPSDGTWVHRYSNSRGDGVGKNDESTYQISTGYRQTLESTAESKNINLASENEVMKVAVKNTITFSNKQVYDEKDQLFMKLTVDLKEYMENSVDVKEVQFPVGTTGKVHFYIQDVNNKYYSQNNGSWSYQDNEIEAASYDWVSQGANMELLLSEDGRLETALDLSSVRSLIRGDLNSGDSKIIITAKMDIDFNSQEVLNAAIPGSEKNGADRWVQLQYIGRISTRAFSLPYSTVRATADDNAQYYRGVKYEAVLSMDATSISQLGINPLELVPEYLTTFDSKKASRIDLMAALNLSNLQDIESVLEKTESITFTLSLLRGGRGSYDEKVSNASNYIGLYSIPYDESSNTWSWTILKENFFKDGQIVQTDIFNGTQFTMPLTAYVFTNQKEYANYRIQLTVKFNNNLTVNLEESDAYVVYTFACIKPEFYNPETQS
ncbi:MAG: hypothetical protein ACI4R7_06360 [Oliverpabstia sp.]